MKWKRQKNGKEALSKLSSGKKPDLIITDLNMPIMDGITFIKEVRKKPGFRFLPILMLTTESKQEKRQEAKKAGATGWLVKPVKPNDLLAVVKKGVAIIGRIPMVAKHLKKGNPNERIFFKFNALYSFFYYGDSSVLCLCKLSHIYFLYNLYRYFFIFLISFSFMGKKI